MDKKKKNASGFALYGAVLVCLTAVGIGGWRLIHSGAANRAAQTRTAAVSGPALVPEQRRNTVSPSGTENTQTPSGTADTSSRTAAPANTETSAGTSGTPSGRDTSTSDTTSGGDKSASGTASTSSGTDAPSASGDKSASGRSSSDAPSASPGSASGVSGSASGTGNNASQAAVTDAAVSTDVPDSSGSISTGTAEQPETLSTATTDSAENSSGDVPETAQTIFTDAADNGEYDFDSPAYDSMETLRLVVPPLEGQTVTVFAMEELLYNDTLRDWRTHDGVDIAAAYGAQVLAAGAGTVVSVTDDLLMGTTVVIRHDGDWETVYSCLENAADIEAGEDVSAGQVIGFVGQYTGAEASLGPHLHFGVFNGGTAVNPETFLNPAENTGNPAENA